MLRFKLSIRRWNTVKVILSDFEHDMVADDRLVYAFQKLLIHSVLPAQPCLRFTENGPKKEKIPSEWHFTG